MDQQRGASEAQRKRETLFALYRSGRFQEADALGRQILAENPRDVLAMNVLGLICYHVGRNDLAIAWYQRAIAIDARPPMMFNNMGEAYRAMGKGDEAIACYQAAIERDPKDPVPRNNMAIVLALAGRLEMAMAVWREVIAVAPGFESAHNNLGNAYLDWGMPKEAAECHRHAMQLAPQQVSFHSNYLRDIQHLSDTTGEKLLEEHRAWWKQHGQALARDIAPHLNDPSPQRRLRIGWVSGDFREHSVAYFIRAVFEHHNRDRVEFICYSDVANEDAVTQVLRSQSEGWRVIRGQSDEAVAKLVRDDRIDILIDLSGHTAENRMRLFARKPAPVQISYLGYPCTSGCETIDYRLTDGRADPEGMTDSHFTETLLRLPRTAWCYRPASDAPEVLVEKPGPVTFGSFNHIAKATPVVIETWARILRDVPEPRLLLKANGLAEASVQARLSEMFAAGGVARDRLIFRGKQTQLREHLSQYHEVDIALDTFPYNGTTTSCEAMWMGVPVVTVAGNMHMARVGVSLLSSVGLGEMIAKDLDDYVRIAVELARDASRLRALRQGMRQRIESSALRDEKGFAKDVEQALRTVWEQWCVSRRSGSSGGSRDSNEPRA